MNWRIVLAVVVAFVLGVGAGGLAEHQHAKAKSDKKSTSSTTAKGKGVNWFGKNQAAACPTLNQWKGAVSASYLALLKKSAWPATQTELTKQSGVVVTSYRALLPKATKPGRVQLNALIAYQTVLTAAIKKATSVTAYTTAQKAALTPRVRGATTLLTRMQARCATA